MCFKYLFLHNLAYEVPYYHACCDGDVHAVFGAELGYLDAEVALVYDFLLDAFDFVAEDYGVFFFFVGVEVVEFDAVCALLYRDDGVALCAEVFYGLARVFVVCPVYGVFGAEGCLVYFGVGWGGGDAA